MRLKIENSRGFIKRRCDARRKNGTRCAAWCSPGRKRCRNHGGLSTGPKFPEGREASFAARDRGLAHWREQVRRQKEAGLISRWPTGRKRGPQRYSKTPEGHTRTIAALHAGRDRWLADMRARRAAGLVDRSVRSATARKGWAGRRRREERDRLLARHRAIGPARAPPPLRWPLGRPTYLERLERTFIEALNRSRHRPAPADVDRVYGHIVAIELACGRATGREERLARIQWERERFHERLERERFRERLERAALIGAA